MLFLQFPQVDLTMRHKDNLQQEKYEKNLAEQPKTFLSLIWV